MLIIKNGIIINKKNKFINSKYDILDTIKLDIGILFITKKKNPLINIFVNTTIYDIMVVKSESKLVQVIYEKYGILDLEYFDSDCYFFLKNNDNELIGFEQIKEIIKSNNLLAKLNI